MSPPKIRLATRNGEVVGFFLVSQAPQHLEAHNLGQVYYCMRCEADLFRISPSGAVVCGGCGAVIGNIVVIPRDSPKGV